MPINFNILQAIKPPEQIATLAPSGGGDDGGIGDLFSGLQGLIGGFKGNGAKAPVQAPTSGPGMNYGASQVSNAVGTPSFNQSMPTQLQSAIQQHTVNQSLNMDSNMVGQFKHGGKTDPNEIIFHDTAGPTLSSAMNTLKERGLSYNYLIDRDGSIHSLVPPGVKAFHAKGHNDNTIGISFVGGGGFGNLNEQQFNAAQQLAGTLKTQFPTLQSFAGHSHRSNAGKIDPEGFDYKSFEQKTGLQFAGGNAFTHNPNAQFNDAVYRGPFPHKSPAEAPPIGAHTLSPGQIPIQEQINNFAGGKGPHPDLRPASNNTPFQPYNRNSPKKYPSDTFDMVRGFEDFRSKPYWDVNAYRVGYGSDTITKANGQVVKVTPGMQVSKADAERDLQRRIPQFQATIKKQIGNDTWNKLDPRAQASLTSVGYNYGSLPKRIIPAVKSGDPVAISRAIRSLGGDNKGVNKFRRNLEADYVIKGQKTSLNDDQPLIPQQQPLQPQQAPLRQAPVQPSIPGFTPPNAERLAQNQSPQVSGPINWGILQGLMNPRG